MKYCCKWSVMRANAHSLLPPPPQPVTSMKSVRPACPSELAALRSGGDLIHLDNISLGTKCVCTPVSAVGAAMADGVSVGVGGDRVSCLAECGVVSGRAPASDMCNNVMRCPIWPLERGHGSFRSEVLEEVFRSFTQVELLIPHCKRLISPARHIPSALCVSVL